ncbi:MAG TPA: hypothetical protein VH559_11990 [Gemmatimonadaceae bacterium]|jgi:hypothetical protein
MEVPLTRFLFDSREFSGENAKPRAFKPMFDGERQRLEHSVFRTNGLDIGSIWTICTEHVEPNRGRPGLAFANIPAGEVIDAGLRVEQDEPPMLHSVIVGWPKGDDNKDQVKSLSQLLASKAQVSIR